MRLCSSYPKAYRGFAVLGVGALVAATLACGSSSSTTSGTTTSTTIVGVLVQGGLTNENVTVGGTGEMDVQLSSLTPQTTIEIGMGIGQPSNGQCALVTYADDVKVGSVLPVDVTAGVWCIIIQDVGNLSTTNTFTLTVTHP